MLLLVLERSENNQIKVSHNVGKTIKWNVNVPLKGQFIQKN